MLCTSLQKCCLRLNSDQARILVNISLVVKDTECPKMMWLEWCNLLNNGILNNSLKCWYKCTQCLGYRFYKLWLRIRKRLCFGLSWTVVSGQPCCPSIASYERRVINLWYECQLRHFILSTSVELPLFSQSMAVRGEDQYYPNVCMVNTELTAG